jgi:hypothetical protein
MGDLFSRAPGIDSLISIEDDILKINLPQNIHISVNGDLLITINGETSILSKNVISIDSPLLLLNCFLTKQLRELKDELKYELINILGGLPSLTSEQLDYLENCKIKAVKLLELNELDVSHLKRENFETNRKNK